MACDRLVGRQRSVRRRVSLALLGSILVGGQAPVLAAASNGRAREASRAPNVMWTKVSLPARENRPDLEAFLKSIVEAHTRQADWGARRDHPIEAELEVREFTVLTSKDVVRVTCTGMGRLSRGPSARSHFSMGGRPSGRERLEREVLAMMGRGIVGRLAEMARAGHPAAGK